MDFIVRPKAMPKMAVAIVKKKKNVLTNLGKGWCPMIKCREFENCNENGFNGCCESCPDKVGCKEKCTKTTDTCGNAIFEGTTFEVFESKTATVITNIADLVKQKAAIEVAEKSMREKLEAAMVEYGIEKIDHEILKISYIKPTTRTSVDSKKLQATYPHIYAECSKTSNVKGYVKIELKGAK